MNKLEHQQTDLAALILAGGQSKRMGQDKALLDWYGVPLLFHICQIALECTADVTVITPWPDRYCGIIPTPVQLLLEQRPHNQSQGPLFAFEQGFRQIDSTWLLLLACDMPQLNGPLLNHWKHQLSTVDRVAIATLPKTPRGWEPLCGFYHRRCLSSLKQALEKDVRAFQPWLSTQTIVPLTADADFLQNCNTPEQWQQLMKKKESPYGPLDAV